MLTPIYSCRSFYMWTLLMSHSPGSCCCPACWELISPDVSLTGWWRIWTGRSADYHLLTYKNNRTLCRLSPTDLQQQQDALQIITYRTTRTTGRSAYYHRYRTTRTTGRSADYHLQTYKNNRTLCRLSPADLQEQQDALQIIIYRRT